MQGIRDVTMYDGDVLRNKTELFVKTKRMCFYFYFIIILRDTLENHEIFSSCVSKDDSDSEIELTR